MFLLPGRTLNEEHFRRQSLGKSKPLMNDDNIMKDIYYDLNQLACLNKEPQQVKCVWLTEITFI
jgi:hypothetical protein